VRTRRTVAQPYEPMLVRFTGARRPGVGDRLLSFRVERTIDNGQVVVPSGVLLVHRIDDAGAVAVVINEYNRVTLGDFLIAEPAFDLVPGEHPLAVPEGMTATVLGFQQARELHGPGDIVFLDRGERDGVRVGDEFVANVTAGDGWSGRIAGKLQVVRVREGTASARITHLDGPIFHKGMSVLLAARMP
jgi:hypothetical protein